MNSAWIMSVKHEVTLAVRITSGRPLGSKNNTQDKPAEIAQMGARMKISHWSLHFLSSWKKYRLIVNDSSFFDWWVSWCTLRDLFYQINHFLTIMIAMYCTPFIINLHCTFLSSMQLLVMPSTRRSIAVKEVYFHSYWILNVSELKES